LADPNSQLAVVVFLLLLLSSLYYSEDFFIPSMLKKSTRPHGKESIEVQITQKNRKTKRKLLLKKRRALQMKGTHKHIQIYDTVMETID